MAALDLGSNTFLLLVAEIENGRLIRVIQDEYRLTRLGQGVDKTQSLSTEALQRAEACLKDYARIIAEHSPQIIKAVATSAARDAVNSSALLDLGKKYGIEIRLISGDEEARISFLGGSGDFLNGGKGRLIDVGGASTEFIFGGPRAIEASCSLNIGSVRLTERYISRHPIKREELNELNTYIRAQLATLPNSIITGQGPVVAVAGTPTSLAAIVLGLEKYDSQKVHGFRLEMGLIEEWNRRLAGMSVEERCRLPGMEPLRADVVVAGLSILLESAKAMGVEELRVSAHGIRYGLALEATT
ncbi:MAG: Ppx/GppA family phosphatase [Bdellovibrionales bacterium]|nr:Ppx/GppA family phosphatase [Bdellovibrionales bacterium]